LTLIAQNHTQDSDWEALCAEFSADEAAYLTFAIAAINLWNRTQIAFRVAHTTELPTERARVA
jgi:alkylhydroperoxidase family enzyme